jgi:hypothetical protein
MRAPESKGIRSGPDDIHQRFREHCPVDRIKIEITDRTEAEEREFLEET